MATLRIPKLFELGLIKIYDLTDEVAANLISVLREAPLTLKPKALASTISAKVTDVTEFDIEQVIMTMTSLYLARADMEMGNSEFLEEIVEAISESPSAPPDFTEQPREKFRQRLNDFLNIHSFGIVAKAQEVLHQHEHALSRVRILTDIRPVFGKELTDSPDAAVLMHTLKITYLADGEFRDFFVAMASSDIKMLREALDRAEKKAESLKTVFSQTGVNIIEPE